MKIILGIFTTSTFKPLQKLTDSDSYGTFCDFQVAPCGLGDEYFTYRRDLDLWNAGVILTVMTVLEKANKVIFNLDGLFLPLSHDASITCAELELILLREEFINKTTFYKDLEIVPTQKVLDIINKVKTNTLSFDDISFN